ncbi:hypothetical protein GCM10017624_43580 [Azotobacter vinelandii]|nr:hypothetical protein GCM10017624_43580 [Azotobacter vinelandii]SFX17638.1 hypothetical protein SAMN04244547_00621 [Azotobacter vinelandii]
MLMQGVLILTIAALLYLTLSVMVMDLLIELISHVLQDKTGSVQTEDSDNLHAIPLPDGQALTNSSAMVDARQDETPCLPSGSGLPDRRPIAPWLFTQPTRFSV